MAFNFESESLCCSIHHALEALGGLERVAAVLPRCSTDQNTDAVTEVDEDVEDDELQMLES